MTPKRLPRRTAVSGVLVVLLMGVAVTWAVPGLIRATHAGHLPLLARVAMPNGTTRQPANYLEAWEPIGHQVFLAVLTLALVIVAVGREWIRRTAASPPHRIGTTADLLMLAAVIGLVTGLTEA